MDELLLIFLSLACSACIGAPAFLLCRPFADLRGRRWQKALMLVGLGYMGSLPIWVGDPNLLYALPVFLAAFLLCTRGDLAGRLAVGVILFCLIMSLSALIDNYAAEVLWGGFTRDVFSLLLRAAALTGVWLVLKKRLPEQPVSLSPRLWRLVLGLAAMPLCSLAAVMLLTGGAEPSPQVDTLALKMGLAVLPVALVTSVLLLFAILVLAEHETLEQARRLASLRVAYYQALRARESQVRQLRHDLRNHLSVLGGLMEQKRWAEACAYLDELGRQEGLQGPVRFCALLGNALDNAREGAARCPDPWVRLRCRQDKGLFMLRVENPVSGPVDPDLATTKADRAAHGFGIPGMREIAQRCGGTLQAGAGQGRFCLLVSLPSVQS